MPRFPRLQVSFVLCLVWETACHQRQVSVPLPPPHAAIQPAPPPPAAPAATSSEATPVTTHQQEPSPYQVNKPPQPVPAVKKPARSASAPATTPAPTPATTPAAPPPKLGDILTPDERKQFSASIDQSLSRAQASLNSIGGHALTKDQQAQVDQIRNFMQQAQTTRASDPSGAKSLAERADVLARDLAARFH